MPPGRCSFRDAMIEYGVSGYLYFPKRVLRRVSECRACFQVRNISDVILDLMPYGGLKDSGMGKEASTPSRR